MEAPHPACPPAALGPTTPRSRLRATVRAALAAIVTLPFALRPLVVGAFTLGSRKHMTRSGSRAFHAVAPILCHIVGLRVRSSGDLPGLATLVAPNHLSYLDVLVLATVYDSVFVSRADVRGWPGIGILSRLGGTIYVDRAKKRDAVRTGDDVGNALLSGLRVTVFLEGRAGDGSELLPFRSSLLAPACAAAVPCVAASLTYDVSSTSGGTVARDVAWTDEKPFMAHVMNLLSLPSIDAHVRFGPVRVGTDRKALASTLADDCRRGAERGDTP